MSARRWGLVIPWFRNGSVSQPHQKSKKLDTEYVCLHAVSIIVVPRLSLSLSLTCSCFDPFAVIVLLLFKKKCCGHLLWSPGYTKGRVFRQICPISGILTATPSQSWLGLGGFYGTSTIVDYYKSIFIHKTVLFQTIQFSLSTV